MGMEKKTPKCSKCIEPGKYSKRGDKGSEPNCLCLKHLEEYLKNPIDVKGATGKSFIILFHDEFDFHWEDGKWKEIPMWKEIYDGKKDAVLLPFERLNIDL